MYRILVLVMTSAFAVSGPATAGYVVADVSTNQFDADWPALAHTPGGDTQVAWEEEGVGVWTQAVPTIPPDEGTVWPPVFQGAGQRPVLAWTWRGMLLVWIDGSAVKYRYGWGPFWGDPAQTIETGQDLQYSNLDIQGCAEAGWNVAWVTYTTGNGATFDLWFLRIHKGSYDPPELIASGLMEPGGGQVAAVPSVIQPLPRVYYFADIGRLAYRTGLPMGGWEPAAEALGLSYGSSLDVRGRADGAQAVLSLGPQPTCPCNVIHYSEQTDEGGWSQPTMLTVSYDAYDWPLSPQIGWGAGDDVHAFWLQRTANEMLVPGAVHLEYWSRQSGVWANSGDFLDPHESRGLGWRVAMALTERGQPVFAWTRKDTVQGEPQPRRIWLARPDYVVSVPEREFDDAGLELAASPNPGHARFALAGRIPPGENAALAVYDLAGRRVTTLLVGPDAAGRFATSWNGRDDLGRLAPAGAYLLRLTAGTHVATRSVIVTR